MTATLQELRARRRENKRQMKTAQGEVLELCRQLEDVLAALIFKLSRR
jgi:hypothetical protein